MTNAHQTSQPMTIVSACVPSLDAGMYRIAVTQTIANPEAQEKPAFSKEQTFWVAAPRFRLPPADVYAVYPPDGAAGHFADSLPHVVLSRRTLPWERQLHHPPPAPPDNKPRPWMALLVLDEDELRGAVRTPGGVQSLLLQDARHLSEKNTGTLDRQTWQRLARKDVHNQGRNTPETLLVPLWNKEPWEQNTEPCTTLDLPLALFHRLVPAWEDLPYLAHARHVGTQHMAADGIDDAGWFAVVIGNRLPTANKESRAFLVSLEGLEAFLPSNQSDPPAFPVEPRIRLIVLTSWHFVDHSEQGGFLELAQQVRAHAGPLALSSTDTSRPAEAAKAVTTALEMGYVPLTHTTRQGYKTVSWYRGPLVPLFLPTDPQNTLYACADAALRYDPHTGLFDVSYAAAWQLGRLLALQNTHFAQAVYKFKLRRAQQAAEAMTRQAVLDRFGLATPHSLQQTNAIEPLVLQFFQRHPPAQQVATLGQTAPTHATGAAAAARQPPNYAAGLHEALAQADNTATMPPDMTQWLGRLFLLHGVPFHYLVPHQMLLPPESLRFFYLDTGWIGALLDGALSIGRTSETRLLLDKAMAGNFLQAVLDSDDLKVARQATHALGIDWPGAGPATVIGHLTGFVLRSALVSGWRGLQIAAYGDAPQPLPALRMERLAADILLCIYNGQIKRVVITQPPQSLHFGVLRTTHGLVQSMAGKEVRVPRRQTPEGAVRMAQLATDLGLADKPAAFARHMLLSPVQFTIPVHIEATKPRAS